MLFAYFLKKKVIKNKCVYDERQELIRGIGYKYAFFSTILSLLILLLVEINFLDKLTYALISIFIGLSVLIIYSIFNDAYFTKNRTNKKLILTILSISIFLYITRNITNNTYKLNMIYLVFLQLILISLIIKYFADKRKVD